MATGFNIGNSFETPGRAGINEAGNAGGSLGKKDSRRRKSLDLMLNGEKRLVKVLTASALPKNRIPFGFRL